jgi:hypothetical protein
MNSNLKIFLKKAVVFIAMLIVLDYAAGSLLKYFYFKHEPLVNTNTTYVANKCNEQVLIFGSSHAQHNYNPKVIASSFNTTCFNAGSYGCNILYYYAMLKCVLKRYNPKIVILDIRADELQADRFGYDHLALLLPYYDEHPEIRPIIKTRSNLESVKLLSKTYRFNSTILTTITRNIYKNPNEFKTPADLGFVSNDGIIKAPAFKGEYYPGNNIDTVFINTFKSFIKDCTDRKIKLYVFVSPILPKHRANIPTLSIASNISRQYHIPYFDYSNTDTFKQAKYFYDQEHMNFTGARHFTDSVISKISGDINQ